MIKKILALIICLNIFYSPAYCIIQDDFVQSTLDKTKKPERIIAPVIKDNFIENSLNKNLQIKTVENKIIKDVFAEKNANKNISIKQNVDFGEQIALPKSNGNITKKIAIYNSENSVPIKIKIKKHFSTRHKIDEGDYIEFITLEDVKIKNKTYPAGTSVQARVETISQNKIWGVPSDLVIGNFTIDGKPLKGEINKTGANRSLWLYPTIYMTTFCFGLGLLLIPIRGGHAKISPSQTYIINYLKQ